MVPILPGRLDWPSGIGNLFLNFGMLEYLVFVFLKDHLTSEKYETVKEQHLKDRLAKITRYLMDQSYPAEMQASFEELRQRIDPIREIRNHIAHGHLYVRMNAETQLQVTVFRAKDLDTGLESTSRHIEFSELVSALSALTKIIEEFKRIAGFKDS